MNELELKRLNELKEVETYKKRTNFYTILVRGLKKTGFKKPVSKQVEN